MNGYKACHRFLQFPQVIHRPSVDWNMTRHRICGPIQHKDNKITISAPRASETHPSSFFYQSLIRARQMHTGRRHGSRRAEAAAAAVAAPAVEHSSSQLYAVVWHNYLVRTVQTEVHQYLPRSGRTAHYTHVKYIHTYRCLRRDSVGLPLGCLHFLAMRTFSLAAVSVLGT